jgi:3-deoxy-D-manno-octulosonic-acid transferase
METGWKLDNVFLFLYHFVWTAAVLAALPFILLTRPRRLLERLAPALPPAPPGDRRIWVHALSVGEVISAVPLIRSLKRHYPRRDIVFTVTTVQGMEIARKSLKGEVRFLLTLPLDFWWSAHRMVRFIRPALFILVETDLWPGLLLTLKKRGIRTLLVNGRISPRTLRSYRTLGTLARFLLNAFDRCLMQSEVDARRLLSIGIDSERVKTIGNIKFDSDWTPMSETEHKGWLDSLRIGPQDTVWVAGSTHEGEERLILDVFLRLLALFPGLRLIIAPRRIEEAENILRLGTGKGLRTALRTDLGTRGGPYDVLVLNTIGELGRIYGIGRISFVGGSLVPVGGHNLLEPAGFGCPVLFGPHTHNFVLMSQLLIEAGGGKRVKDSEDLFVSMKGLLSGPEELDVMGRKAGKFVDNNRGALNRVMDVIERTL